MSKCIHQPAILDAVLERLTWPVKASIFGELFVPAVLGVRPTLRREDWSTVRTPRRASAVLWRIFGSSVVIAAVALVIVGVIRAFQTHGGTSPFNPTWLITLTMFGLGTCVASLMAGIGVHELSKYKEAGKKLLGFAGIALLFTLTGSVIVGGQTLFNWLPAPLFGICGVLVAAGVACGFVAQHRDRVNNNVYRRCFDAAAMQLGGRTSIIADRAAQGVKTTSTQ